MSTILTRLATDARGHLLAGAAAAGLGTVIGAVVGLLFGADWLAFAASCSFVGGLTAGITKERADWLDNQLVPGMHGVELRDIGWTMLPGSLVLVCVVAWRALA